MSCAHHHLSVIGLLNEVRIMNKDVLVATHQRDWGREAVHFDPVHYLALLERRPGAFDFARPMANWQLPSCFDLLRRRLEIKGGSEGTRQYIQVLRLLESSTVSVLAGAVSQALTLGTLEADAVAVILQGRHEKPVGLFSLDGRPHLQGVQVKSPDLAEYAVLAERSMA